MQILVSWVIPDFPPSLGHIQQLMGDPGRAEVSLEMASSGISHRLSAATGPFPLRIASVDRAGVEGRRTPGEKGLSGLNLPCLCPAPPLAGVKVSLCASSSQGRGSLLIPHLE